MLLPSSTSLVHRLFVSSIMWNNRKSPIAQERNETFKQVRHNNARLRHVNNLKKHMEIRLVIFENTKLQFSKGNKEEQTKMCVLLEYHKAEFEKAFQAWHDAIFKASHRNLQKTFTHSREERRHKKHVQAADDRDNQQKEIDAMLTTLLNTPP